jgi:hypothetical protein
MRMLYMYLYAYIYIYIGILAFADCYDASSMNLDYALFVEYASEIIPRMRCEKGMFI